MNRYKRADELFIDDFLKGKITETDLNIIYEIINYRYNNNLPVILSTEKTLDDLVNFDEATASRLIEMSKGHIIVFEGKKLNYRLYGGDA
jgi:DNA replication protein DnaC